MTDRDSEYLEFTERGLRNLLGLLKSGGYRFAKFGDDGTDRHVLWRHDIDVSVHRAFRLAQIEAEEGVFSTYFVNPRSAFYNFLEPDILALLKSIKALGHDIGLHFDAEADGVTRWTNEQLEAAVRCDRSILATVFGRAITAVSWHNPDLSNLLDFDAEEVGGLLSTYSAKLRRDYVYCSDSNGYWRFKPMGKVIAEAHLRLHLLTHPEWWTPEPLSPSDRIDRALMGRARAIRTRYDSLLKHGGRRNIGSAGDSTEG
jgi:hypothetical protein